MSYKNNSRYSCVCLSRLFFAFVLCSNIIFWHKKNLQNKVTQLCFMCWYLKQILSHKTSIWWSRNPPDEFEYFTINQLVSRFCLSLQKLEKIEIFRIWNGFIVTSIIHSENKWERNATLEDSWQIRVLTTENIFIYWSIKKT